MKNSDMLKNLSGQSNSWAVPKGSSKLSNSQLLSGTTLQQHAERVQQHNLQQFVDAQRERVARNRRAAQFNAAQREKQEMLIAREQKRIDDYNERVRQFNSGVPALDSFFNRASRNNSQAQAQAQPQVPRAVMRAEEQMREPRAETEAERQARLAEERAAATRRVIGTELGKHYEGALTDARQSAAQAVADVQSLEGLYPFLARGENPVNEVEQKAYDEYQAALSRRMQALEALESAQRSSDTVARAQHDSDPLTRGFPYAPDKDENYYSADAAYDLALARLQEARSSGASREEIKRLEEEAEQAEHAMNNAAARAGVETRTQTQQIIDNILGVDRREVTGGDTDVGKLFLGMAHKGAQQFSNSIWKAANMYLDEPAQAIHDFATDMLNGAIYQLKGFGADVDYLDYTDNLIRRGYNTSNAYSAELQERYAANANTSRAAQVFDAIGTETAAAVPYAFMAAAQAAPITGNLAHASAYASSLGEATGAASVGLMTREGFTKLVENPQFWTSYVMAVGESYDKAVEDGLSPENAAWYATVNGVMNAMVEIGGADEALGGIQRMFGAAEARGGKRGVAEFAKTMFIDGGWQEMGEEIAQGALERGIENLFGANNPVWSVDPKNENAVLNPWTAAREGVGAFAVGSILGGVHGLRGAVADARASRNGAEAPVRSGDIPVAPQPQNVATDESDALNSGNESAEPSRQLSPAIEARLDELGAQILALEEQAKNAPSEDEATAYEARIEELSEEFQSLLLYGAEPDQAIMGPQAPALRAGVGEGISLDDLSQRMNAEDVAASRRQGATTTDAADYSASQSKYRAFGSDDDVDFGRGSADYASFERENERRYVDARARDISPKYNDASESVRSAEAKRLEDSRKKAISYNNLITPAIEEVELDPRNASKIINGEGIFDVRDLNNDPDLQTRADLLNELSRRGLISGEYYVSGGKEIVRANSGNSENIKSDIMAEDDYDRQRRQEHGAIFKDSKGYDRTLDRRHTDDMAPAMNAEDRRQAAQKAKDQEALRRTVAEEKARKEKYTAPLSEAAMEGAAGQRALLSMIQRLYKQGERAKAERIRQTAIQYGLLKESAPSGKMEAPQTKEGNTNDKIVLEGRERESEAVRQGAARETGQDVTQRARGREKAQRDSVDTGAGEGTGTSVDGAGNRHLIGNNALDKLDKASRKSAEETQQGRVEAYEKRGGKLVDQSAYDDTERKYAKRAEKFGASFIVMDMNDVDTDMGAVTMPGLAGIIMFRNSKCTLPKNIQFTHEITHFSIRKMLGVQAGTYLANDAFDKANVSEEVRSDIRDRYESLYANYYLRSLTGRKNVDFASYKNRSDAASLEIIKKVEGLVDEEIYCDLVAGNTEMFDGIGDELGDDFNDKRFDELRDSATGVAKDRGIFTDKSLADATKAEGSDVDRPIMSSDKSYMDSLEENMPPEKEAPPSDEEYGSKEYDNARGHAQDEKYREERKERRAKEDKYQEERYNDKHGFDNAKGYEQQRRWNEKDTERRENDNDPEASYQAANRDFGEKAHNALLKASDELDDVKLYTDRTNDKGKALLPAYKDKLDTIRSCLRRVANGTMQFEELVKAYEALNGKDKGSDSYYYSEEVAAAMQEVLDDIEMLKSTENEPKKSWVASYRKHVARAARMLAKDIQYRDSVIPFTQKATGEVNSSAPFRKGGAKGAARSAVDKFNLAQMRPSTFLKMVGGMRAHTSAMNQLAERQLDSLSKLINTHQHANSMFREIAEKLGKEYDAFATGKTKGNVDIPGIGKVSMNTELGLLKLLETKGAIQHAETEGLRFADEADYYRGLNNKGRGDTVGYVKEYLKSRVFLYGLRAQLKADVMADPVAKALYEKSKEVMTYAKGEMNEVQQRMWGEDVATQDDTYWPMHAEGDGTKAELGRDARSLRGMSILQQRKGPTGALRVVPFTEAMSGYIDQFSDYVGFAEFARDIETMSTRFQDGDTLVGAIDSYYGKKFGNYLRDYIDDLNGNSKGGGIDFMKRLRSNLAASSLLMNGSVALKQTPSYWNAAGVIDFDLLAKNWRPLRSIKNFDKNPIVSKVNDMTGFLESRKAGMNTVEMSEMTKQMQTIGGRLLKIAPSWMKNWIGKQDVRTVSNLVIPCYEQALRNDPTLKRGSKEHYEATVKLFERAVMQTQPIYEMQGRAAYHRADNDFVRMFSMFRTQQTQNFNNLYEAIGEFKSAKAIDDEKILKASKKKLGNVIAGQIASTAMFAVLQGLAAAGLHKWKDYEDEDGNVTAASIAKKLGIDFAKTLAGTVWFGDSLASFATDLISKGKTNEFFGITSNVESMMTNLFDSTLKLAENPSLKNVKKFATNLAQNFGVPLGNAYNLANAVTMWILEGQGKNAGGFMDALDYMKTKGAPTESRIEDYLDATEKGVSPKEWYAAYEKYKELNKAEGLSASEKSTQLTIWLQTRSDLTDEQRNLLRDQLTFFSSMPANTKTLDSLMDKGFDAEEAAEIIESKKENADTSGNGSLDSSEVYDWIMSLDYDREQQEKLWDQFSPSDKSLDEYEAKQNQTATGERTTKTYESVKQALVDAGVKSEDVAHIYDEIETSGNGKLDQSELYKYYQDHPDQEEYVMVMWSARGFSTTWEAYKEKQGK